MRLIFRADVFELRVVILEVVVAIRQPQAALIDLESVVGRITRVLRYAHIVRSGDIDLLETSDDVGYFLLVVQRPNRREVCLKRMQTGSFDPRLVHETGVEVADLLRLGSGSVGRSGRALEDRAQLFQRDIGQLVVQTVRGLVWWNRSIDEPRAVRVPIKIILGAHAGVDSLQCEPRRLGGGDGMPGNDQDGRCQR